MVRFVCRQLDPTIAGETGYVEAMHG
jgi:hypothetical protein